MFVDPNAGEWYQRCFIKTSGTNMKASTANVAGPVNRSPPPPNPTCQQIEDNIDYNNGNFILYLMICIAIITCIAGWLSLLEGVQLFERHLYYLHEINEINR